MAGAKHSIPSSRYGPLLLIVAGGLVAFGNGFFGVFVFDDYHDIIQEDRVHNLWTSFLPSIGTWRPVAWFSLAVNYALGKDNPFGYHAVNLTIHILAALTLYGLVRRTLLLEPYRRRYEGSASGLALVAALLWMTHPLQTESVTYIVQRYESLMGLFYLLTLYCLVRGATAAVRHNEWYLAAAVSCALGMGSKEVMVTAPVTALLYDRVFLSPSWRELFRRRWPLYAGLAATWGLLAVPIWSALNATEPWAGFGMKKHTALEYAQSQPGVIVHYLRLAFWPDSLCFDYGWPVARSWEEIVPPALLIGTLLAATAWALWSRPALGFLGAWFFVILAPTSSIMPIEALAFEHRMYLSLASVAVLVVFGGYALLEALGRGLRLETISRHYLAGTLAALAVLSLGWATIQRNKVYFRQEDVWSDVVAKRPENMRARQNLSVMLYQRGAYAEAREQLEFVQNSGLSFYAPYAYSTLGDIAKEEGKFSDAEMFYRRALALDSKFVDAHKSLGEILLKRGSAEGAVMHFTLALSKRRNDAVIHNDLGAALLRLKRPAEAKRYFQEAIRLDPNLAEAYDGLGSVWWEEGEAEQASRHYVQAILLHEQRLKELTPKEGITVSSYRLAEIRSKLALAHNHLGAAQAQSGSYYLDRAQKHLELARKLDPNLVEAQENLKKLQKKLEERNKSRP